MKNTRKWLAILLTIAMVLAMAMLATGCGDSASSSDDDDDDDDKPSKTTISSTTTTEDEGNGGTTTTTQGTQNTNAVKAYVEENEDDVIDLVANGAPDSVEVQMSVDGNNIVVKFISDQFDELAEDDLDQMGEIVSIGWVEIFWELRDEVAALNALELEFYNLDGDYLFGGKVDEDTPREDEEYDEPEQDAAATGDEELILGTWEVVYDLGELDEEAEGMTLNYTMIFKEDGVVEISMETNGESDSDEGEYYFEDGMLYLDGDTMEYTLTEDTLILDVADDEYMDDMTAFLFPMELTRV